MQWGSFNSLRKTIQAERIGLGKGVFLNARLSQVNSDGYIDRASALMNGYQFDLQKNTLHWKFLLTAFGGNERTYQSWYGVDAQTLVGDRTFNYAGLYTDELGNTKFYDNQIDNYQQHHFQLHWNEKLNSNWSTNLALHYTKGNGYYEEYVEDQSFSDYGLTAPENITLTDLVRRKWLDNDFFGTTFSIDYKKEKLEVLFGGSWNKYFGDHYGQVIWTKIATPSALRNKYYENTATKMDGTAFLKVNYQLFQKWNLSKIFSFFRK
jgi:iron complex outermembrane receptor protein